VTAVGKVNEPLAPMASLSMPLSTCTFPAFLSPMTVPPIVVGLRSVRDD